MAALCLVHLLWGPFGPEAAARFGAAYRSVDPGVEHRFVALYNGFGGDVAAARDALGIEADQEVVLDGRVQDLIAYRRALDHVDCDRVAFVNSWAEPLVDGWLAALAGALGVPGVGIAGCTGSWESPATAAPAHALRALPQSAHPNERLGHRRRPRAVAALGRAAAQGRRRGAGERQAGPHAAGAGARAAAGGGVAARRRGGGGLAGGSRLPQRQSGDAIGPGHPHPPVRRRRSTPAGVPGA